MITFWVGSVDEIMQNPEIPKTPYLYTGRKQQDSVAISPQQGNSVQCVVSVYQLDWWRTEISVLSSLDIVWRD